MSKFLRAVALSVAMVAGVAGSAQSATVQVTTQGGNAFLDSSNQNGWYQTASYTLNGIARTAAAGLFRLKETTAGGVVTKFVGVCLEPLEWLNLPKAYDEGSSLSYLATSRLGALVDNAMGLVKNSQTAAAFQLAAWEIANEGKGTLDLNGGAFKLSAAQANTKALAQSWLDAISGGKWKLNAQVMILRAPGTQDLVTDLPPAPIPVPAAGLLLLGGLGSIAAARRARRA